MIVKTKNRTLSVIWRYDKDEQTNQPETTCIIKNADKEGKFHPIASGTIRKYFKDAILPKDTVRRIALTKALRLVKLDKEARADIWEAYRTSSTKPRWQ